MAIVLANSLGTAFANVPDIQFPNQQSDTCRSFSTYKQESSWGNKYVIADQS